MESNIIYGSIIVFIIFILGFVFWQSRKHKIDNLTVTLLTVALLFILFSMWAPKLFTQHSSSIVFNEETGQIGDTIGGIMNPFISMAAVIVTGMAFYAQYRANEMVRKQFELQKFENQFYEMLRLHKENVNEIEVKTADGKDVIKGRAVFFQMKKELEWLLENLEGDLDEEIFTKIYGVFFWGYCNMRKESVTFSYKRSNLQNLLNDYEEDNKNINWEEKMDKGGYNKLPEGHHSYLGHYYRHLFHIVKFVVTKDKKTISEEQKLDYLRILRAQLSNYEQEMLFYNWLSGYGEDWENDKNQFFTKYKIIHNLWYSSLYGDDFIKGKLKYLVEEYKRYHREERRKYILKNYNAQIVKEMLKYLKKINKKEEGNLFEIGDEIDEKFY